MINKEGNNYFQEQEIQIILNLHLLIRHLLLELKHSHLMEQHV